MADLEHLHPVFRERIQRACAETGAYVLSGGRSTERQAQLYNDYLRGVGNPANPPGTSWHEYGNGIDGGRWTMAVDLAGNYGPINRRGRDFSLCFPVAGEAWHAQPVEITESARVAGADSRLPPPTPKTPVDPLELRGRTMLVIDSGLTTYAIRTFAGKVLDVPGASVTDRTTVVQWEATGGPNQKWYLDLCGADVYRIIARHSGRVLDLLGPGPPGAPIQQYAWAAVDNQRWRIEEAKDGSAVIVSVWDPDLVLDVLGRSSENGTPIIAWHRSDGPNQRFQLVPS